MKRIFYYTTTALVLSCGIVKAQTCVPTPTCSSLGYTSSTACDGGLKCPFGEAWNCDAMNKIAELEQKIEQQEQDNALKSCAIGHIFYSDMSCSVSMQTGKTPIGVVVYTDGQGHGQVLALKSIGSYKWGPANNDISTLTNFSSAQNASYDLNSCPNTEKIIAAGDKSKYPAAWAAHEYSTEGTSAGDWCLPAAGIFTSYYNNQQLVNIGLTNAGGTTFTDSTEAWSSSENDSSSAWHSYFSNKYGNNTCGETNHHKGYNYEVFPVLEF